MSEEVTKKKKIFFNMATGGASILVTIILGFIIPRLVLTKFGSEVNGVVTSINQIFSYFYLLEAGVGIASLQALYDPISKKDTDGTSRILTATDRYYHRTGMAWAVLLLIFAFLYSRFAKSTLSPVTIFLLVIVMGMPMVISYLVQGTYRIFLTADGKSYVVNLLSTASSIVSSLLKIAALYLTKNIVIVQALFFLAPAIQPILVVYYVKTHYDWCNVKHPSPDYEAISQKSSALVHQVCEVIFNNSDVLLLTFMTDYKTVSVYATYSLIYDYAGRLINSMCESVNFTLGQMFHNDRKRFDWVFEYYETCYIGVIFIFFTVIFLLTTPFISLYTEGVTDAKYVDSLLPFLFVMIRLLMSGKAPSQNVVNMAEHFDRTRSHAVIEVLINLVVSVAGILKFGIYGCLLGTICALFVRGIITITYADRKILQRSPVRSFIKWILNFAVFGALYLFANPRVPVCSGYMKLIVSAVPIGLVTVVSYGAVNGLLFAVGYISKRVKR